MESLLGPAFTNNQRNSRYVIYNFDFNWLWDTYARQPTRRSIRTPATPSVPASRDCAEGAFWRSQQPLLHTMLEMQADPPLKKLPGPRTTIDRHSNTPRHPEICRFRTFSLLRAAKLRVWCGPGLITIWERFINPMQTPSMFPSPPRWQEKRWARLLCLGWA